jgi:hypothetical protein
MFEQMNTESFLDLTGLQVREAGGVPEGLVPGPEQGGGDLPGPHHQDGGGGRPCLQVTQENSSK